MVSATPEIQQAIDLEAAQSAVATALRQDDLDSAAVRAALGRVLGGEASPVASVNGGKSADAMLTIYHRYDGREHRMPSYQVAKTLTARIPNDIDTFPPQVIGQIAWSLEPEQRGVLKREYGPEDFDLGLPCYFSPDQQDERIRADVQGAGLPFFCRKGKRLPGNQVKYVHFTDAMALEAHLKKHQRAYPVFTKYREERRARERETADLTTNQAILTLIQNLMAQQTAPTPAMTVTTSTSGSTLTVHDEAEAETFACPECGKQSKSAAGRAAHMRSHEGG